MSNIVRVRVTLNAIYEVDVDDDLKGGTTLLEKAKNVAFEEHDGDMQADMKFAIVAPWEEN